MDIVSDHAWVPFFIHTVRVFWVRSLKGKVQPTKLSNLGVKLARHSEMFFNISITSPVSCPSFPPLVWIPLAFFLSCLGHAKNQPSWVPEAWSNLALYVLVHHNDDRNASHEVPFVMWTPSRITRPNNEREPMIVLWTDSNGRPRPVVYDKQKSRYKEDATNGGGNSVW